MKDYSIEFDKYKMRLLKGSDIEKYYRAGFENPDDQSAYFTGAGGSYTKEQIVNYIEMVVKNQTRYDFIIENENEIVGEVVLMDIDDTSCHYRICIFNKENFSKGIGFKATVEAFKFVFNELGLDSVELEVFPFNDRGIALYKKLGFEIIDMIVDEEANEPYKDIYLMRLQKENFSY